MSYIPLKINENAGSHFKDLIRRHVDMQFHDVHSMLKMPIDQNIDAGCNFAIANTLLSLLSGISALTTDRLDTSGRSKKLFKMVLKEYYPWESQCPVRYEGSNPKNLKYTDDIGEHLYDYFRNALAHSLGLREKGNAWIFIAKHQNLSEEDVESIERGNNPPGWAVEYELTDLRNEKIDKITLYVDNFYWGVRKTLERLSEDSRQVGKIETALMSLI